MTEHCECGWSADDDTGHEAWCPLTTQKPGALPPDPDGKNQDRADWADIAITTFQHETKTDHVDALADLLADLMHWADRHGYSFDSELERARMHYEEETQS